MTAFSYCTNAMTGANVPIHLSRDSLHQIHEFKENIRIINAIKKRDGRIMPFDCMKIEQAIAKAFAASGSAKGAETAHKAVWMGLR